MLQKVVLYLKFTSEICSFFASDLDVSSCQYKFMWNRAAFSSVQETCSTASTSIVPSQLPRRLTAGVVGGYHNLPSSAPLAT